jgi:hypothetical protein
VSQLLASQSGLPLSELAEIGTRSILVVPTLAYYVGVLTEVLNPQPELWPLISDGTLADALSTAALLVRLMGDIGKPLTFSAPNQTALINALWEQHKSYPEATSSIAQLLTYSAEDKAFAAQFNNELILTRFHKDLVAGEFNVCLDNLAYTGSLAEGLDTLEANLAYFSQVYYQGYKHLKEVLAVVNSRMKTTTVSTLIMRFVQFYTALYTQPYKTKAGEYVA